MYAWIRTRGSRVWTSDSKALSGPRIEVWKLPDSISSPDARDRLWESETRGRQFGSRLARWCGEMAQLFVWRGEFVRGEEWARRCLSLNQAADRQLAYEALTFSQIQQGRAQDAEASAREALAEFPNSELLHIYRAMAFTALGDAGNALSEYRQALPLCSTEATRGFVRSAMGQLEGTDASRGR
jgi:tetratricopeptide (TPR) repeat protein